LSTAHVICEGLGFEAGIDHKFQDARISYWLYTILIVAGAGIILIPNAHLWEILIFSQVGNGVWLPIAVIFILLLVNRRDLMGEYVDSVAFHIVAWVTAIAMILLTPFLVYASLFMTASPGT
jgi:Mn2+/Fe2+ NRAMP family transporter